MRKFKFLALAFAAFSFAACSDDAIEGQSGSGGSLEDASPAYLTISFTANSGNSSRSTADDANNNGDEHSTDKPATGEDSGHHNSGTEAERTVDRVLVVIVPSDGGNVNYAKLYSTTVDAVQGEDGAFKIVDQTGGTYANNEPIELATGTYNVIVVANPVADLITGITVGDLNAGIRNNNEVEDLYTKITTGNYNPSEADYKNIAAGKALTSGTNFRVMMANKGLNTDPNQAYTVTLTEENGAEGTPATASIEVERVLSKITFRETDNNIYEIFPKVGAVRAKKVDAAIYVNNDWVATTLNVATDALGKEVYVWVQETTTEGVTTRTYTVYKKGSGQQTIDDVSYDIYTAITAVDKDSWESTADQDNSYAVEDTTKPQESLTYKPDDSTTPEQHWYVRLEGYALVNLSKNVHYVRHTISNAGGETPFGVLNGSNYLYTPYWGQKNGIVFEEDKNGDLQFPAGFDATTNTDVWFYNTLAKVAGESETMTIESDGSFKVGTDNAKYYKPMNTLGVDGGNVTGEDHYEEDPTLPSVGKFMAYCFENSTDLDHQTHGLSTGISFVARMYKTRNGDDLSDPVTKLYRYGNNSLFESLEAIQQAFGKSFMSDKFNELVEKEKGESNNEITKDDLERLAAAKDGGEKIEIYNDNICYYYTTEIKHFDNGDNSVLGNMEFAIMRNNIYSLAVTGINMVGDSAVDPTPGTPDENPTPESAQLNVDVEILPWIVRYNDIEF